MSKKDITDSKKLILWIIATGIMGIFFALIYFLRADFSYRGLSDAFFIPGVTMLGGVILLLVGRAGFFDNVAYFFVRLRDFSHRKGTKSFEDAYEYREYKHSRRDSDRPYLLPFLIYGGGFVIAGIIYLVLMLAQR
ncbi:MAG: DUF3899 domain-containing protein [Bacilli bacterium]|jgi:hypothetical protein|nr:DUF3899 domain-containing protein [Bacilli bacterium]